MNIQDEITSLENYLKDIPNGRRRIYTNIVPDSEENVRKIIEESMPIHEQNRYEMKKLLYTYLGIHNRIYIW